MESVGGLLLLQKLKNLGVAPKHVEFTKAGNSFYCNVFNYISGNAISHSVCTGFDASGDIALLKALTEFVERKAYSENFFSNQPFAITNSSDGFAAYPVFDNPAHSALKAKEHAHQEAFERFVWATWWDHKKFDAKITPRWKPAKADESVRTLVDLICENEVVDNLILVEPSVDHPSLNCMIFFAKLSAGGYISGGAAGALANPITTIMRGLAELLRHLLALRKLRDCTEEKLSFYEQRLRFFGIGLGDELVEARLDSTDAAKIEIPKLRFDQPVAHSLSEVVAVHRCLFENQPEFVGGKVSRLCL